MLCRAGDGTTRIGPADCPRPPSVQRPRARPQQPPKGSGKVGPVLRNQRPKHGEVGQVGARIVVIGCRVSRGQISQECDRVRVIPASFWMGASSAWFVQASAWSWPNKAIVAAVAEQDRLQEEYNIGPARLEELKKEASAIPPPMEVDSSTDRIQQFEAMVAELRRERGDLRTNVAVSKRAGEVAADPTKLVLEVLEELPQWITSTSATMPMAMEREDLALVAELSAQLAAGGMKLASAKRRCNPGSAIAVAK